MFFAVQNMPEAEEKSVSRTRSVYGMWSSDPAKHAPVEDVQGIVTGAIVSALGFYLLNKVGLLTGGTAGVAFLLHYAFGISFGLLFITCPSAASVLPFPSRPSSPLALFRC
jgi:hypothetical protein